MEAIARFCGSTTVAHLPVSPSPRLPVSEAAAAAVAALVVGDVSCRVPVDLE